MNRLTLASLTLLLATSAANAQLSQHAVGVTEGGTIIVFDANNPLNVFSGANINLPGNERIVGMDYNVADDQIYALTNLGNFGTLSTDGIFNQRNVFPRSQSRVNMNGSVFGVDINPVTGRMHVISDTEHHFIIDLATAAITAGPVPFGTEPNFVLSIGDIAFSNNVVGATTTTLYARNVAGGGIYTFDLTTGHMTLIRYSGNAAEGSLDIAPNQNTMYQSVGRAVNHFELSGTSEVNFGLTTVPLVAMTLLSVPTPAAASLLAGGIALTATRRRRA